ncbi:DNA mismatch repair protein MutT [Bifidobacterium aquikefiri]|uniref:DNA mismatch repair protein MutT n=1 Tax=Bifidobacterium aquikefiri TaxID=1653207 RepID=A0A261G4H3_9BIFI|nr:NUDIX domain-containing protein [Bifidobacterium aquikefiri]OZG66093.1 DNA mismatch repair protein MutT [Bifidobacterium aquikefiri]
MSTTTEAAGAIVYRWRTAATARTPDDATKLPLSDDEVHEVMGNIELCLVHRPKYTDWSWPKGKVEENESLYHTAVREVGEETGIAIALDSFLRVVEYPLNREGGKLRKGNISGNKRVSFWMAHILPSRDAERRKLTFGPVHEPDLNEIDDVRWVSANEARHMLSHSTDRDVLDEFTDRVQEGALHSRIIFIVRHSKAESRKTWLGEDSDRPLMPRGAAAAYAIGRELACFDPTLVVSSPWLRCIDTIRPFSLQSRLHIHEDERLTESSYETSPDDTLASMNEVIEESIRLRKNSIVCTHRPLLGGIFDLVRALCVSTSLAKRLPTKSPYIPTGHGVALSVVNASEGPRIIDIQKVIPIVY